MAWVATEVFDNGLSVLSNVDEVHICTSIPENFLDATSTFSIGSKATTTNAIQDGVDAQVREVKIAAFNDGTVTSDDDAFAIAWVDAANSKLYVGFALDSSFSVVVGNGFSLDEQTVGIVN